MPSRIVSVEPSDPAPLRAWLAAHLDPAEPVAAWRGGEVGEVDGRRVVQLPWPQYSETIDAFWHAVDAAGWQAVATGDYMTVVDAWRLAHGGGPLALTDLSRMDRATLFNQLRAMQRAERFCDGSWAASFRAGWFHAAARALIALG